MWDKFFELLIRGGPVIHQANTSVLVCQPELDGETLLNRHQKLWSKDIEKSICHSPGIFLSLGYLS